VKAIVRLDHVRYDVALLQRDLAAIEASRWIDHFAQQSYTGGWDALPLVSAGGRSDAEGLRRTGIRYRKTELLAKCPYFESIVDSFRCEKERVRLLRMRTGAIIESHVDPGNGWSWGIARLHIPITTNEGVSITLDGQRLVMKPGELWYLDVQRVHSARNAGDTDRVHLVLDLVVNDYLRSLFPDEPWPERLRNVTERSRDPLIGHARALFGWIRLD
jgi:hypothetical protein